MTMNEDTQQTLALICQEVLDTLNDTNETPQKKCDDIRDNINSWISANNLPVAHVERCGNFYAIKIKKEG